eukprot:TRINITY_DN653_c0_g1_i1.p1 TRINITY_DN653_c0_g1~~TRINITY_DN653_c0_g1_i1.p1  ORF type:complete len:336 (-),score=109.06 TRINITY_DN653_c0_g1_i1:48-1028(-)
MATKKTFKDFTSRSYPDQAKAFLNAYWKDHQGDAETLWKWYNKFVQLDTENGKAGKDLDEFNAHRFLEAFGETKTIKELREAIARTDIDFNKRMALIEYCLWKFGKKVEDFLKRPQGDSKEIEALQELMNSIQRDLLEAQKKAETSAKKAEESEKKAKDSANKEAAAKKAAQELQDALNELKKQEESYKAKTEALKKKSEDENLGVVARNKAKNELAQHLAEDPLPLSKAKLTTEAATKKAEKTKKEAEEARKVAEEAAKAAKEAAKAADAAVDDLQVKFKEAEDKLEEAKSQGVGQGNVWWMERELSEARKFMPTKAKLKESFGQ